MKLNWVLKIVFCFLIIVLFSTWFQKIWIENFSVGLVVLLTTFTLIFKYYSNVFVTYKFKILKPFNWFGNAGHKSAQDKQVQNNRIATALFIVCVFFQIISTNIKNAYSYTPSEIDRQITRMRYYPPKITRLAYWLEYKKETLLFYKLRGNFTDVLDIKQYFPNYYSFLLFPFAAVGLYEFVCKKDRLLFLLLAFNILLLAFLGVHGKYGPFLMFPFINLWVIIGMTEVSRRTISVINKFKSQMTNLQIKSK